MCFAKVKHVATMGVIVMCFWVPSMGVFEMRSAKKVCLAWRPKSAYLCIQYACNSVFRYLVWMCLKYTMPKDVYLVWRPKHAYLCTQYASNSVFGYLVWVCLKCTMPKNVLFWRGLKRTYLCPKYRRCTFIFLLL